MGNFGSKSKASRIDAHGNTVVGEVSYRVEDTDLKIVVIGEPGSGKRTLIDRIIGNAFDENAHLDHTPKTMVLHQHKGLKRKIRFYSYDTVNRINEEFYSNAQLLIVCCNINKQDPIEQLKSIQWELDNQTKNPNLPILYVCTMADTWRDNVGTGGVSYNDIKHELTHVYNQSTVLPLSSKTSQGLETVKEKVMGHLDK